MNKRSLKRIIDRYARAKVEMSWLGSQDMEDHDAIRDEYQLAKKRLDEALDEVLPQHSLVPRAVEEMS